MEKEERVAEKRVKEEEQKIQDLLENDDEYGALKSQLDNIIETHGEWFNDHDLVEQNKNLIDGLGNRMRDIEHGYSRTINNSNVNL